MILVFSTCLLVAVVMEDKSASLNSGCDEKLLVGEVSPCPCVIMLSSALKGERDCPMLFMRDSVSCCAINTVLAEKKGVPRMPISGTDGRVPSGYPSVPGAGGMGRVVFEVLSRVIEAGLRGVVCWRFVRTTYGDCATCSGGGKVPCVAVGVVTPVNVCTVWGVGSSVPGVTVGTVFVGIIVSGVVVGIVLLCRKNEVDMSMLVPVVRGRVPSNVLVVIEEGGEVV
jgi:hypothetical protein